MLYLTRKIGESVVINDDIEVTVVDIRGKSIKLGFTFPAHASVLRREIYERIQEENRAAAAGGQALADALGAGAPTSSPDESADGPDEARDEEGRPARRAVKD
jgi:carbon storage regulator